MKTGTKREITLLNIAMTKAWNYGMEYNSATGREQLRPGYEYLKEGYIQGFLAGFAYKFEPNEGDSK